MFSKRVLAASAAAMMLASCGGEDGGGTGGGATAVPPPTSVVPPSPPPPPTPPPPPSYALAFDFTYDQSTIAAGAEARHMLVYDAASPNYSRFESATASLFPANIETGFTYRHADQSLTAGINLDATAFTAADLAARTSMGVLYRRSTTEGVDEFSAPLTGDTRYVRAAWQSKLSYIRELNQPNRTRLIERMYVYGSRTNITDLPATGNFIYNASSYFRPLDVAGSGAPGQFTIDFPTKTVRAKIPGGYIKQPGGAQPLRSALLEFDGQIDADGRISGTISTADTTFSGRFVGYFYGPAAGEIGLVLTLMAPNGETAAGQILARR